MTYAEMAELIEKRNADQNRTRESLPHCSNLLFQISRRQIDEAYLSQVTEKYLDTRLSIEQDETIEQFITREVAVINEYMNFFWPLGQNALSHQADFYSSIIPEMLCSLFEATLEKHGINLSVSAQQNLTIECTFDITKHEIIQFKKKRVDVAVFKSCKLSLDEAEKELPIPLLAIECKTNVDKNMLSGIEQSVDDLKKTFPGCEYLVVSELSDFDVKKTNYAASGIDEMYILRQQKRADIRSNPNARQNINPDLVREVVRHLVTGLNRINADDISLVERMQNGKLIGRVTQ